MTSRAEMERLADRLERSDPFLMPEEQALVIAALRSLPDAREALKPVAWQAMETAPKEGKFLALMHDGRKPPNPYHEIIGWNSHGRDKGAWMNGNGSEYAHDAETKGWARPLGWMPLPALASAAPPPSPRAGESERPPECEEAFDRDKLCPHLKETDNRGTVYHCDVCEQKLVVPDEAGESREAIIEALEDVARIKVQRDNALLDMEKFMNQVADSTEALEAFLEAYEAQDSDNHTAAMCHAYNLATAALAAARHRGEANDSPVGTPVK
jgi:hypothetical protein